MTGIILIIIGFIIIAASYLLSEKIEFIFGNKDSGNRFGDMDNIWVKSKDDLSKKIDELIADKAEDAILKADDSLSKISNEKIMSFSEFSDQILDKIDQNHSEVVFLYNMLNEKENEIKDLLKKMDNVKTDLEENLSKEEQEQEEVVNFEKTKQKEISNLLSNIEQNNNEQILKLYKEGKSIVEISKRLRLGQGEVKLVIELFQGVKS